MMYPATEQRPFNSSWFSLHKQKTNGTFEFVESIFIVLYDKKMNTLSIIHLTKKLFNSKIAMQQPYMYIVNYLFRFFLPLEPF